jgi:hypothetical protein
MLESVSPLVLDEKYWIMGAGGYGHGTLTEAVQSSLQGGHSLGRSACSEGVVDAERSR